MLLEFELLQCDNFCLFVGFELVLIPLVLARGNEIGTRQTDKRATCSPSHFSERLRAD